MAQGDLATCVGNAKRAVKLLEAVVAVNGQPSAATDGIPCYPTNRIVADDGVCFTASPAQDSSIFLKGTGTGAVTVTARLWGYLAALGEWVPVGTGSDGTKGVLNAGAAFGAVKAGKVLHVEALLYGGHFDRLYLEVTAIGGTSTSVDAWVVTPRPSF